MSNPVSVQNSTEKESFFQRFLNVVEFIGNKFPTPFTLFALLGLFVLLISWVFDGTSVSFVGQGGKTQVVKISSLLTADGFRYILTDMIKNFINFPPLGLVVTMMLAMGLAESSGFISAFVRKVMMGVPPWAVTATVMLLGINGNLASDASMVFVPAAAAAVYAGMGRNPILGMSVAFAATSAGFSANFLPAGTDALLAGITQSATGIVPQTAKVAVHPLINYYLMSSSVIMLTVVGTLVAEKVVAPRLDKLMPYMDLGAGSTAEHRLTPEENKGLKYAGWTAVVYILILLGMLIPETGLLRDPKTHSILPASPLLNGIIPILFFFFLCISVAFGYGKGIIKKEGDATKLMTQGMAGSLSFIVTAFSAAQFVAWFTKSNIATIMAVKGAEVLKALDFTGIPLIISFVLLAAFVDLFVISGSAKWLVLAPVFVPMFGLIGYEPALTQAAYRIGESSVNTVTPLNYYVPVMLGIMSRYLKSEEKTAGMGTLMATQLPYALAFLVCWTAWLILFIVLDLPLGPGAKIFL
ncbi:AbgT family transporter [Acetonema longum]|uniref:Aminobenzoyl-glutamate transport protein n=1 Tax=Acetonema longum DSM 6540 TaxID=1009370 RepID=F7NG36_9FIRM|nr:AbgT family transporter [Acetonema longum]EGO64954.1 aminobenzoyl-glutamate transport protein [Acetonema longum DSM 6540]